MWSRCQCWSRLCEGYGITVSLFPTHIPTNIIGMLDDLVRSPFQPWPWKTHGFWRPGCVLPILLALAVWLGDETAVGERCHPAQLDTLRRLLGTMMPCSCPAFSLCQRRWATGVFLCFFAVTDRCIDVYTDSTCKHYSTAYIWLIWLLFAELKRQCFPLTTVLCSYVYSQIIRKERLYNILEPAVP